MEDISDLVNMFRALGDEGRLNVVLALREGELSASALAANLKVQPSMLSHRLKALFVAGLLDKRRDGQQIFYKVKDEHVTDIILNAVDHVYNCNS